MTRRESIKAAALIAIAGRTAVNALGQSYIFGFWQPLFSLPALSYPFDALEPFIDARTMELHYKKQHAAYVANLNNAIEEIPDFYFEVKNKGLTKNAGEGLLKDLSIVPEKIRTAVRDNAGGHYNHTLFWQMLKKKGGRPSGALAKAIDGAFGSFSAFKGNLAKAAMSQFGSGWAWLVIDENKQLAVVATSNEDSPITQGKQPLLGIDVWEHAYYLKYQNRRSDYVEAFFNVIDWAFVSQRYDKFAA